jgi:hypothetical protein
MAHKRVPLQRCPKCNAPLSAVSRMVDEVVTPAPSVGDFNICLDCGAVLVFGEGFIVRTATPDEIARIICEGDAALIETLRRVQAFIKYRRRASNARLN